MHDPPRGGVNDGSSDMEEARSVSRSLLARWVRVGTAWAMETLAARLALPWEGATAGEVWQELVVRGGMSAASLVLFDIFMWCLFLVQAE